MKTFLVSVIFFTGCCWWGCQPAEEKKTTVDLASLEIVPHPDTLNMLANGSQSFSLRGTRVSTSEQSISNSGIIADAKYTVTTSDTTTVAVNASDATWSSSNTSAATVAKGVVTARNAGFANITAAVGAVTAQPLLVSVKAINTAPGLSLNPPQVSVIFTDTIAVSGNVQLQATLSISETSSHHNNQRVAYNGSSGNFTEIVDSLGTGFRTIVATARNANQPSLATTRYKYVYYYIFGSVGADSICGDWLGTTLGQNFNFNISKNQILRQYDINGHIDIQFGGLGLVRDITLTGFVNRDGTMNVGLTQTYQGFTISGNLKGYFKTTGTGEGSYSSSAKKSGWPSLSGSADWTAVKKP
jgi:hypothetical protein